MSNLEYKNTIKVTSGQPNTEVTDGSNTISHTCGIGSPAGVVTANPGSSYVNYTTGDKWHKSTGSGNTGWVQEVIELPDPIEATVIHEQGVTAAITAITLADAEIGIEVIGATRVLRVGDGVTPGGIVVAGGSSSPTMSSQAASYTLALGDAGNRIQFTNATAAILTVPTNASVAIPVNTSIDIWRYGAGTLNVAAAGGVTIRSSGSRFNLAAQYSWATLVKVGTNEWTLFGEVTA